jgi:glycosyltransferase 2 family protein
MKKLITNIVFFGIAFFFIYYSFKDLSSNEIEQIKISIKDANYFFVLIAVVLSVTAHWLRALRWKILCLGAQQNVKTYSAFAAIMIAYLANMAVPRLGEVSRCTVLAQKDNAQFSAIAGTVILERIFDVLCLLTFGILTLWLDYENINSFLLQFSVYKKIIETPVLFFGIIASGIIMFYAFVKIYSKYKSGINNIKNPTALKIFTFLDEFIAGLQSVFTMQNKIGFLLSTIGIWVCYLSTMYIGFYALSCLPQLSITAAMAALFLSSIGMIISPGGIGATPKFTQQSLVMYGSNAICALSFGWLSWLLQAFINVVLGGYFIILMKISKIDITKNQEIQSQ